MFQERGSVPVTVKTSADYRGTGDTRSSSHATVADLSLEIHPALDRRNNFQSLSIGQGLSTGISCDQRIWATSQYIWRRQTLVTPKRCNSWFPPLSICSRMSKICTANRKKATVSGSHMKLNGEHTEKRLLLTDFWRRWSSQSHRVFVLVWRCSIPMSLWRSNFQWYRPSCPNFLRTFAKEAAGARGRAAAFEVISLRLQCVKQWWYVGKSRSLQDKWWQCNDHQTPSWWHWYHEARWPYPAVHGVRKGCRQWNIRTYLYMAARISYLYLFTAICKIVEVFKQFTSSAHPSDYGK